MINEIWTNRDVIAVRSNVNYLTLVRNYSPIEKWQSASSDETVVRHIESNTLFYLECGSLNSKKIDAIADHLLNA